MRDNEGRVVVDIIDGCVVWATAAGLDDYTTDSLPDLDDPAALGCLLALVREAWGDRWQIDVCIGNHDQRVMPCSVRLLAADGRRQMFAGLSLAEALVAALEAAHSR